MNAKKTRKAAWKHTHKEAHWPGSKTDQITNYINLTSLSGYPEHSGGEEEEEEERRRRRKEEEERDSEMKEGEERRGEGEGEGKGEGCREREREGGRGMTRLMPPGPFIRLSRCPSDVRHKHGGKIILFKPPPRKHMQTLHSTLHSTSTHFPCHSHSHSHSTSRYHQVLLIPLPYIHI